jgi:threonine/homoserine/homoserine lactone efflux protein
MNILAIFVYSMWHIFLPGESTPILVALRVIGTTKRSVLRIGLGLAISNGFIMIVCLSLGLFFSVNFEQYATGLSVIIRVLGVLIFFAFAVYILLHLKKYDYGKDSAAASVQKALVEKHTFKIGFFVGIIPSPADLGFLLIGSMIPPKKLCVAIVAIWLGVIISFTMVSFAIGFIPIELLKQKYDKCSKWLHIIASVCLMLISLWLGYMLWKDYSYCL